MPPAEQVCLGADNRTDVDPFASEYGGAVISMAINLRQHLIMYSDNDLFEFPYSKSPDSKYLYKILEEFKINGMHKTSFKSSFEGIIGAGLGSSGAITVAMIGAINRRLSLGLTKDQIAQGAWEIETKYMGLGGKQDQWASVYGGFNHFSFGKQVEVSPLPKKIANKLLPHLSLFYVGGKRDSHKIQKELKQLTSHQINALGKINKITTSAVIYLSSGYFDDIGYLLNQAWQYKKESNPKVSSAEVDFIYDYALKNGALGGKLLGAGGGGHMLFFTPPEKREYLIEKMQDKKVSWVDFGIDYNGLEVRVL